jgi:hypothetical protein
MLKPKKQIGLSDKVSSANLQGDIVPLYDEDGRFIATLFLLLFQPTI